MEKFKIVKTGSKILKTKRNSLLNQTEVLNPQIDFLIDFHSPMWNNSPIQLKLRMCEKRNDFVTTPVFKSYRKKYR